MPDQLSDEEKAAWKHHGTRYGYSLGCRCEACKKVQSVWAAKNYLQHKEAAKPFITSGEDLGLSTEVAPKDLGLSTEVAPKD